MIGIIKDSVKFEQKLEYSLIPQTPIIHFQHAEHGSTLRATEVKPKFDEFLLKKAEEDGIVMNNVPVTLDEFAFDDDAQISDYATESVYFMFKCGIIKGMTDVEFAPQGVATKEQALLISNRINSVLY